MTIPTEHCLAPARTDPHLGPFPESRSIDTKAHP